MGVFAVFLRSTIFFVVLSAMLISGGFALAAEIFSFESDNQKTPEETVKNDSDVASEQKIYPGVENKIFKSGNGNEPHVTIYYPAFGNEKVDEILREFAVEQGADYEKDIQDSFGPDDEKPESYEMWEMTGLYTISERPSPNIVSVTFNIYSYTGGAHGNLFIRCINADLSTGKILTFADLFANPAKALEILSKISEQKLRAELGDEVEEDMLRSGVSPELNNFLNLSLNPEGLAVEFQPYQVGPWAIGAQRVEISLSDLAEAEPDPAVWAALKPAEAKTVSLFKTN